MKTERVRVAIRIKVDLNSKLIQIAEHEDMSKNKLIEKALVRMVSEYEKTHPEAFEN